MAKHKTKSAALAILGMHRSGTSVMTRVVNLLGAYVGEDEELMQSGADNPEGFWEHQLVYALHERLLAALQRNWDTTFPLPPDWQHASEIIPFREELIELIESRFAAQPLWAWKDPRTCILLPLWQDVLAQLNIELRCLLVTRNPLDVARSLNARNGFPMDDGFGLWFNHNLAMLHNSAGLPRAVTSYQRFLRNWEASVAKWAPAVGLAWSADDTARRDAIRPVVRKALCHSASTLRDLAHAGCPPPVVELARMLDAMAKSGSADARTHEPKIRRLVEMHATHSRLYAHDFSHLQQQLGQRVAQWQDNVRDAREKAAERKERIESLRSRLEEREEELAEARLGRASRDEQIKELEREVSSATSRHAGLQTQLADAGTKLADAEKQLADAKTQLADAETKLGDAGAQLTEARSQRQSIEHQLELRDSELADSRERLAGLEAQLVEAREQHAEIERELRQREGELIAAREQSDRSAQVLQTKLTALQGQLVARDGEAAMLRERLSRLMATYSWKITKPLRKVLDAGKATLHGVQRLGLRLSRRNPLRGLLLQGNSAVTPPVEPDPDDNRARGPQAEQDGLPEVSIIIPVFNRAFLTKKCLQSLHRHASSHSFEILVVDDASTDDTPAMIRRMDTVRYVRQETNQGFGAACNRGAAEARGKYLVFLNNDTTVAGGWLDALRGTFDDWPEAGLVGSKLLLMDGTLQECGGLIFRDGSAANYGRGADPNHPRFCYTRETDYVSGAAIMIASELFRELDGFDPRYEPAYYEDTDLALRVHQRGLKVIINPHAVVNHHEGGTAGTDTSKGIKRYQVVNREKFLERWRDELARFPVRPKGRAKPRSHGPRVLVVDYQLPQPRRDSGSLRMTGMLAALRRLDCQVTFAATGLRCDDGRERPLERIGIEVLRRPYYESVKHYLIEEGASFDYVILSRRDVASQLMDSVERNCSNAKIVFDTVDLHFVRESRQSELGENDANREKLDEMKALELGFVARSDVTLVVSHVEREVLRHVLPQQDVRVVSNILESRPTPRAFAERAGLMFIGWFRHPPNIGGVLWFVNEVLPELHRRGFDPEFHVIGADAPKEIRALASGQIRIHGFVHDVEPFFDSCLLSVAPLLYGAGVKGKINQSMALGLPVVTTTVGAEGMGLEDGVHALVADEAAALADRIYRACHSEELWTTLREQGLRNIEEHFSPAVAEAALRDLLFERAASDAA